MKIHAQRSLLTKFRWSVVFAVALSLGLSMQALATPKPEAKPAIAASDYHNVARSSDGSVWYWGGLADVSNGKVAYRANTPQLMSGLKDVVEIQSYRQKDILLKKDGTVWEWGAEPRIIAEEPYELVTEFPEPQRIKELSDIVKISAGAVYSAIDKDGSVWVWHPTVFYNGVHKLENVSDATDTAWDGDTGVNILRKDGTVSRWSAYSEDIKFVQADKRFTTHKFEENNKYAVRNIKVNTDYTAHEIEGLKDIAALSKGNGKQNFAIRKDGTVWGWGENTVVGVFEGGKLGYPVDTKFVERPAKMTNLSDVSSIVTNMTVTLVLKKDGSVWYMGSDIMFKAADEPVTFGPELRRIKGLEKVASVALGAEHAVALTEDGEIWTWGDNLAGQLGDGSFKDSPTPILVHTLQ